MMFGWMKVFVLLKGNLDVFGYQFSCASVEVSRSSVCSSSVFVVAFLNAVFTFSRCWSCMLVLVIGVDFEWYIMRLNGDMSVYVP